MNRKVHTPYYLIFEDRLRSNGRILHDVEVRSGAKILLAEKAYSIYQTYSIISEYLSGTTSSGLFEAKLAHEEFGREKEIHVFEPAFDSDEMQELCQISDHLYFNSLNQLEYHRGVWLEEKRQREAADRTDLHIALRLNPELSTQEDHAIYDPCAPGSRLGIREVTLREYASKNLEQGQILPAGVDGLHMHTLCEQGFDDLQKTWKAFEEHFADYLRLPQITWVNLGGGHHITREGYDVDGLVKLLRQIHDTYQVQVYLEPGEAVVLNAGELVTRVMDIVDTEVYPVLILDTSAACHMPDVLEMPYTPPLREGMAVDRGREVDSSEDGRYIYRLSSRTCLSGDVIGDYAFDHELKIGDELHFEDMALYTIVKNNTFNGMPLPSIVLEHENNELEILREFSYDNFKARL